MGLLGQESDGFWTLAAQCSQDDFDGRRGFKRGQRHDSKLAIDRTEKSPFQWATVCLNLPGIITYDLAVTCICKFGVDSNIASDVFPFVDDERVSGATRKLTWQFGHCLAAIQSYLGVQDTACNVWPCSQTP